ncbi:RES domain-containing protein [Lysobacter dokdonensis DS-58]|uniref:RES domain-containing protein n=1 Tax=Lysobacter dokdonensis DS-58 TaxID=1300345 RepID=A0A0A2WZ19_9GAMM|nr:RES family NAD+ phosphorylase [Lysobacter dokdonensis]KGQ18204.1 RES domain-containing protein [Lysobacter dokdonensis DS-58]
MTTKAEEKALDKSIADTFPASDPPSQSQPVTATPTQPQVALRHTGIDGDELHVYRVIEPRKASEPFSGSGADAGGRWTSPRTPGVYASLSPATAMLEYLVHLEGETPDELLLAQATVPVANVLAQLDLPSDWKERPYRDTTRQIGDKWAKAQDSLALRVPSAVCDGECNILLNPQHPDFAKLRLDHLTPLKLDPRLRI